MRNFIPYQDVSGPTTDKAQFQRFWLRNVWRRMSLVAQFTIVATIVVGIIMASLGGWVSNRIESSAINNAAFSAALYMDRFVEPYVQDLATGDNLSPRSIEALTDTIKTSGFNQHIFNIKIWRPDGTIVFSDIKDLVGEKPPISDSLAKALKGAIAPEFNRLGDDENTSERLQDQPLLEIYVPMREATSDRVIAVAEFYQYAGGLADELAWVRLEGVLMVGGFSLLMLGSLIGIVGRGSQTIITQQHALNERIADLSKSLAQNVELRQRIDEANRRASESNERFLRRVGAELHDGPVQLIGLALLRLDGIRSLTESQDKERGGQTLEIIRGALKDALSEIRGLSRGLALPELETLTLAETVDLVITNHELRSGKQVEVGFPASLPDIPLSIKTCVYRFVQEGLNNAFRHAGGLGQQVDLSWDGRELTIMVSDQGTGFSMDGQLPEKGGIGLTGLRDRVEALGGARVIKTSSLRGTQLQASFLSKDDWGL
jgi:signal transduction histidine kinase